jgi:HSP20 family molecular chaperone IbpA
MLVVPVRGGAVVEYQMSYPYQQSPYTDYSNPASPWNIEPQQQQRQSATPAQMGTPSMHSNLTITPPVYQQQLSPIDSPSMPPPQEPQQQQQQAVQEPAQSYTPPQMIQLEERAAPTQNRFRFESINESNFLPQRGSAGARTRASTKAPARAGTDEMRSSTSPSSGGAGPSRVPRGRIHTQVHPYRPGGTQMGPGLRSMRGTSTGNSVSASVDPPVTLDQESGASSYLSLAERTSSARPSRGVPAAPIPALRAAAPCPAMHVWRLEPTHSNSGVESEQRQAGSVGEGAGAATSRYADCSPLSTFLGESSCFQYSLFPLCCSTVTTDMAPSPAAPPAEPAPLLEALHTSARSRRLIIATDIFMDEATNTVVAVLEIPGVKRDTIRLQLRTCPYTGCRQLMVSGESHPSITDSRFSVRERKSGPCYRTISVPLSTKVRGQFVRTLCRSVTSSIARRRDRKNGRRTPHHQVPWWDTCTPRRSSRNLHPLEPPEATLLNLAWTDYDLAVATPCIITPLSCFILSIYTLLSVMYGCIVVSFNLFSACFAEAFTNVFIPVPYFISLTPALNVSIVNSLLDQGLLVREQSSAAGLYSTTPTRFPHLELNFQS